VKPLAGFAFAFAFALVACGSTPPPQTADSSHDAEPRPSASAAASATPDAAPDAQPAASGASGPESAQDLLARDLLKSGGRRIAWSATKKRFLLPVDSRSGGGRGLDLVLYDDEGQQRDIKRICQPGECEDRLDEILKEELPKLAARLGSEGYEAVSSIGWPSGRDELDVATLNVKLRNDRGRISLVREGKPPAQLRVLGGKPPKGDPSVLYPVPSAKLMGVLAGDAFYVVKLP
jgi:hypothetical protein